MGNKKISFIIFLSLFFLSLQYSLNAQTVFVSSKGKKYHAEGCKILASDSKGISLEDAKKEGYKACRKCKVKQIEAIERKEKEKKNNSEKKNQ